jgi:hypothetical protein
MKIIEIIKQYFNKKSAFWAANYPKAWSLGWLTQLTIAAVLYSLTFIVSLLIPMDMTDTPDVLTWYWLGYIPATFWGIFIVYRLVKYNSEKLFGNRNIFHNFLEIPTYLLQFSMPLVIPLILGLVLTLRIGSLIEDKQFNESKIFYEEAQPFFTFNFGSGNYMFTEQNDEYYERDYYYDYPYEIFRYFESEADFYTYITRPSDNYITNDLLYENGVYNDSISRYRSTMRDSIAEHAGIFKDSRPKLYPFSFYEFTYNSTQDISSCFVGDYLLYPDSSKQIYFYNHYKDEPFLKGKIDSLLMYMKLFGENTDEAFTTNELVNLFNNNIYSTRNNKILSEKVKTFDRLTNNYKNQIEYINECKNMDFYL